MSKFKVGDKVKIVEGDRNYVHNHKVGSIGTVVSYFLSDVPNISVDGEIQSVFEDCLELIAEPTYPQIHHKGSLKIVFNPPYTVVIDKINGRTAKAKCKASDEFDETKGLAIALLRLIDPDEDVSWICGK